VEIYPEFVDGLKDIEALSHIYLLYAFHESQEYKLQVKPFLDDQEHGILPHTTSLPTFEQSPLEYFLTTTASTASGPMLWAIEHLY